MAFAAPDKNWGARVTRPTINLFLFDIHTSSSRSVSGVEHVRRNGQDIRRLPPPRIEFSYLVTAWTTEPRDEHQLLGAVLRTVLAHGEIDDEHLKGELRRHLAGARACPWHPATPAPPPSCGRRSRASSRPASRSPWSWPVDPDVFSPLPAAARGSRPHRTRDARCRVRLRHTGLACGPVRPARCRDRSRRAGRPLLRCLQRQRLHRRRHRPGHRARRRVGRHRAVAALAVPRDHAARCRSGSTSRRRSPPASTSSPSRSARRSTRPGPRCSTSCSSCPRRRRAPSSWIPVEITGGSKARFEVVCVNTGNVPLDLALTAHNPEAALRFHFEPSFLAVPVGAESRVSLFVEGKRPRVGQSVSRPFVVEATDVDHEFTVNGTFHQRARIPRGLITAAVLAAIVGLWAAVMIVGMGEITDDEALTKTAPLSLSGSIRDLDPDGGRRQRRRDRSSPERQPTGVPRVTVEAHRRTRTGTEIVASAATDEEGGYQLDGLLPGTYLFRFTAPGFVDVWYPRATSAVDATPRKLRPEDAIERLNVSIKGLPGTITGQVEAGHRPGSRDGHDPHRHRVVHHERSQVRFAIGGLATPGSAPAHVRGTGLPAPDRELRARGRPSARGQHGAHVGGTGVDRRCRDGGRPAARWRQDHRDQRLDDDPDRFTHHRPGRRVQPRQPADTGHVPHHVREGRVRHAVDRHRPARRRVADRRRRDHGRWHRHHRRHRVRRRQRARRRLGEGARRADRRRDQVADRRRPAGFLPDRGPRDPRHLHRDLLESRLLERHPVGHPRSQRPGDGRRRHPATGPGIDVGHRSPAPIPATRTSPHRSSAPPSRSPTG